MKTHPALRHCWIVIMIMAWIPLQLMSAGIINIADPHTRSILGQGELYLDHEQRDFEAIRLERFAPIHTDYLNLGITSANIWLRFTVTNTHRKPITTALIVRSTRLGYVTLYDDHTGRIIRRGLSKPFLREPTRYPNLSIVVRPHETKDIYIRIHDPWNSIVFSILLQRPHNFYVKEQGRQLRIVFLFGILVSLILSSLVLAGYSRDRSYLYYGLYLAALLYQQLSYLGIHALILPSDWLEIDRKLALAKVGLLVITSALFAIHFLKTRTIPALHRIYQLGIIVGTMQLVLVVLVVVMPEMLLSHVKPVAIGFIAFNFLFSLFSLGAGVYYYHRGHKVARLYILGFGVTVVVYAMMAAGALGLSTLLYDHPYLVLYGTILEALILSLAFVDRYNDLQQEKKEADQKLLDESRNREIIVQNEVTRKTAQLREALDTRDLLLREVHHRVKNNLHIILSMIRLQRIKQDDPATAGLLTGLENRINAIAKTYNLLLSGDNLQAIDMGEYIELLLHDLLASLGTRNEAVTLTTDIDATVPLRESVYVGLIINELVTNAYKYAFDDKGGTITVSLHQADNEVTLVVADDGRGFAEDTQSDSLGLKLIETLARDQLRGTIDRSSKRGARFSVSFTV